MKVAFDISPLKSGHSVRGIGSYTRELYERYKSSNFNDLEFVFLENDKIPKNVDLIHYPYFDFFKKTLKINKTPTIVTVHDVIPLVYPKYFPRGIKGNINLYFQKKSIKHANLIICDSVSSRKDIVENLKISRSKIKVIYLAASDKFKKNKDKKDIQKVKIKYNLPNQFALYVGDVNWNKNVENLIQAASIKKINLVMVGKALEDTSLDQVKRINYLIKENNLERKVIRTGYVCDEDLLGIYKLASVTVAPSYHEGFGLPVLESMSCGTPVICSNNSSLSEITNNLAVYCNPNSPKDISEKIEYVFSLPQNTKEEKVKKLIEFSKNFSWEKTAKETIQCYKDQLK